MAQRGQPQFNMLNGQKQKKTCESVPFIVTLTPDARNNPPKRLLKI